MVILDNASIHIPGLVDLIENAGARVIFLPPYSPDYTPIEPCFRQYRASIKRAHACGQLEADRGNAHLEALLKVTRENMINYLRGKDMGHVYCNVPALPAAASSSSWAAVVAAAVVL